MACPRNFVTPLRFCSFCFDRNSEMEGLREVSDVLNWRETRFEDFETCPSAWKCCLENTNTYFCKIQWKRRCWHFSYRFPRKHFYELGQVSKSSKQISLQFKTSLTSLRPSISELLSKQNEEKRKCVIPWP